MNKLQFKNKIFYLSEISVSILRCLINNDKKTQREIIKSLNIPIRSIRYNLTKLLESGIIYKIPNFQDMRSVYYQISFDFLDIDSLLGAY